MREIFIKPVIAMFSAARLLFKNRRAMGVMLGSYVGLLTLIYLFVSTREATIPQLFLTLAVAVAAPVLFFVLQAISVSYTNGPLSKELLKNCFKVTLVTVPVIGITVLGVYGLSKVTSLVTLATALRYLLIGVIAPLLAIQLWVAASSSGRLLSKLRKVAVKAFAPQSVLVYVCGFLIFALTPYLLITQKIPTERAWLEFSLLMVRLSASLLLILLGWVTTVGAISILSRGSYVTENEN
jgi:hypothetical protein